MTPEVLGVRIPLLPLATLVLLPLSMIAIFGYAPTERVQGDVQRIFYFHLPLAWISSWPSSLSSSAASPTWSGARPAGIYWPEPRPRLASFLLP